MDNRHSGSKHAVLHSQICRRSLGPLETCNSDPKGAVLHANSDANHIVLHAQNDR